eukprot:7909996-Karenia_brevis.AAC.1
MGDDLWSEVIMRTDLAIEKKREQAKARNMIQDTTIKEQEEMIRSPKKVVENFIKAHFVSMLAKAGLVVTQSEAKEKEGDSGEKRKESKEKAAGEEATKEKDEGGAPKDRSEEILPEDVEDKEKEMEEKEDPEARQEEVQKIVEEISKDYLDLELGEVITTPRIRGIAEKLKDMGVINDVETMTESLRYTIDQFVISQQGGGKK